MKDTVEDDDYVYEIDETKAICFTGHRPSKLPDYGNENSPKNLAIKAKLEELIKAKIAEGFNLFITGMAEGFDSYAARAVIKLKETHPEIKLFCVKPFNDPKESQMNKFIWEKADIQYVVVQPAPRNGDARVEALFERNKFMVENSNGVIAYNTQKRGGTAFTMNQAKTQGKKVINIADILR